MESEKNFWQGSANTFAECSCGELCLYWSADPPAQFEPFPCPGKTVGQKSISPWGACGRHAVDAFDKKTSLACVFTGQEVMEEGEMCRERRVIRFETKLQVSTVFFGNHDKATAPH